MPIYRNVLKTDAAAPEAAARFILDDTGGTVQHASAWSIIEEEDCWRASFQFGRACINAVSDWHRVSE
jgi:hypothetical protein